MKKKYSFYLIVTIFLTTIFLFVGFSYAQEIDCSKIENRQKCLDRVKVLEKEIANLDSQDKKEEQKQHTLKNEISKLNSNISKTESNIKQKSKIISRLTGEIGDKIEKIEDLNNRLYREKVSLAKILRKKVEIESTTILELLLSDLSISNFFSDIDSFSSIQASLQNSFEDIKLIKGETYSEQRSLEEKKGDEANIKYSLESDKKKIEIEKKEQERVKALSEQKEASIEQLRKQRAAEAAKIRSELIRFQGNGISRSISFGEAYDYAKAASSKTGVRTALILAIMQQETGFGNNVGGCNLRNGQTGDGIYIRSGNPSKRNMVPGNFNNFVKITTSLAMDWKTTPISCAIKRADGTYYGYGGAMGYTQFIPSTWMMVEARVRSYVGISIANPWNPRDAVMATAIFLQDRGASARTYSAEYNAACRYYGACSNYASSVMNKALNIQPKIDKIERK